MSTELIILDDRKEIAVAELFTPSGIDKILKEIEERVNNFVGDMTTKEGREEIASYAYKIARTKTTLDDAGKNLVIDKKNEIAKVDNERKRVRDRLDLLKQKVRQPLTEFEEREEKRIQDCKDRLGEIENLKHATGSSSDLKECVKRVNDLLEYDWSEFEFKAKNVAEESIRFLNNMITEELKKEEERLELEKLRKEKEEREKREHEERIAKEASERARMEAEKEAKDRELKIIAEKEEAERKAKEADLRAKQAEKELKEEECRIAEEMQQRERLQAIRESNTRHKGKINSEARDDIKKIISSFKIISSTDDVAKKIVSEIVKGNVRNISIKY